MDDDDEDLVAVREGQRAEDGDRADAEARPEADEEAKPEAEVGPEQVQIGHQEGKAREKRPGKRKCAHQGCFNYAKSRGRCLRHGGGRRCDEPECTRAAQGKSGKCQAHGGGMRCSQPGCIRVSRARGVCIEHGGGRQCLREGCFRRVQGEANLCYSHGGGRRCEVEGCEKSARGTTQFCIRHGGGKRCLEPGCTKSALADSGRCMRHGGGKSCLYEGCTRVGQPRTGLCSEHTGFCIEADCPKRARTRSGRCLVHDILDRNRHFHEVEELHANAVAEAEAAASGALPSIERMLGIDEDHGATLEDDSDAIILHSHHHENDSAHVHDHGAVIVDTSSHGSRYMDAEAGADLSEARDYEFHDHHHHHHQDHHHHLHHHHHENHDHTLQVPEIQEEAAREGSPQNDVRIAEDEDLAQGHAVVLPAQTSNDHHVDQVNETDQDDLDAKEHEAHVKLSFYLTNQVAGPQGSLAETGEADQSASHMHDPLHIHDHDHFDRIQRPSEVQETSVSCTGADTLQAGLDTHVPPGIPNEEEVLENENQHGEARLHQASELDSTEESIFIPFCENESEEVSLAARPPKRPRV